MLLYLFILFILLPLTGITVIVWGVVLSCILMLAILNWFFVKTELDKSDYYGEYVINRDYFKGEQTDWQYNHFRFTPILRS